MAKRQILKDRKLTNAEAKRRFDDKAAAIDKELDEARQLIDWKRRKEAEKDISSWVKTYCIGLLLDDSPSVNGEIVLQKMYHAIDSHSNYAIAMGRGQGKTSFVLCITLFAILTELQRFVVIFSHDHRAAQGLLNDMWRVISSKDTALAQDYPDYFVPFHLLNGSVRRKQTYKGQSTAIVKNSQTLAFPCIEGKQSFITTRGITSGCRGLRMGTQRPTFCILDDLQDSQTAENEEQVQKLYDLIRKDVIPMGGKQRLSILQTFTPITPDDLVSKIKTDKNWTTQTYPVIIKFPKNTQLWDEYFKQYDIESINEQSHDGSMNYYRNNFKSMNDGAEVFNEKMFSVKDGHLTALQKFLEMKHIIGDAAFASEYQMTPKKLTFALDIKPKDIIQKADKDVVKLIVPDGCTAVYASSDLNLSKYITTTICAFKPDGSSYVIYYDFYKCNVDGRCPDAEYQTKVYDVLVSHGKQISQLGIKLDGWGIDCNGLPFQAVTSFCRKSMQICGIPACGLIGKASHLFNENIKTRLRNAVNGTVLCGDAEERVKAGAGAKWIAWNGDLFRSQVQKALKAPLGIAGGMSLYWSKNEDEHLEFATQICNEKLVITKNDSSGRQRYFWKSKDPHDILDSVAQCCALAASQGIAGINVVKNNNEVSEQRMKMLQKLQAIRKNNSKIKFV